MPKISHRAENMPASPVRKLVPYALQAKQKGIKVYHLNIGQPDIETPQTALDAVKNIDLKVLEYALSEGNLDYRTALKDYYHSLGFTDLTTDNFIVNCSCTTKSYNRDTKTVTLSLNMNQMGNKISVVTVNLSNGKQDLLLLKANVE